MFLRVPLKYFFAITHLSVFLISVLFVGVSTYFITRENYAKQTTIPQISEKVLAQDAEEYLIYERRDIIAARPNENNKVRKTGFSIDGKTFEENIIYSFTDDPFEERFARTAPTASLLGNGRIFVNGVSNSGFAVLDQFGNNFSSEYPIFRDRTMRATKVLFGGDGAVLYATSGNSSKKTSQLIWKKEKTEKITSPMFPENSDMLNMFGLSADGSFLFAGQDFTETSAAARIWKIDLVRKHVGAMNLFAAAKANSVRMCPQQNFGVYIRSAIDPTEGDNGKTIAPSKLFVSDLAADASSEILSSKYLLSNIFVACEGGRIFVQEKNKILQFDISGRRHKLPMFPGNMLFVSRDGEKAVFRHQKKLFLVNLKNGKHHEIGDETRYTVLGFIRS